MTQHDKIIALHENREWVCQDEYHTITWSPHKRRSEITAKGVYHFEERPCMHGIERSKDFLLVRNLLPAIRIEPITVEPRIFTPNQDNLKL